MMIDYRQTGQIAEVGSLSPGEAFYLGADLCIVLEDFEEDPNYDHEKYAVVADLDDGVVFLLKKETQVSTTKKYYTGDI